MVFVGAMWFLIRPLVSKLGSVFEAHGSLTQGMLVVILLIVLGSGWITEQLGIHALFGAFLAGVIMPKNIGLIHSLNEKINDVAVVLLLPLFFAFVGLRANLSLVSGGGMWGIASLIIFVAVLGKLGGSMIAARITRMPWREASALGVLMNTRGLMELVLLNIGLDIGLISPELFGMLVLMAIATTFMTSPVLEWVYFARLLPKGYPTPATAANEPWLELGLGDIKEGEVSHKSDESEDIFSVGEI
jgi:Kef-type K+ transport system membrane component KefB